MWHVLLFEVICYFPLVVVIVMPFLLLLLLLKKKPVLLFTFYPSGFVIVYII